MHYDFDAFLSSIKYLDRDDILAAAYSKHKSLDKSSTLYSAQARLDLQKSISGLLYWLERQDRPAEMNDRDFAKLKPVCENLIKKKQLPTKALLLFE